MHVVPLLPINNHYRTDCNILPEPEGNNEENKINSRLSNLETGHCLSNYLLVRWRRTFYDGLFNTEKQVTPKMILSATSQRNSGIGFYIWLRLLAPRRLSFLK